MFFPFIALAVLYVFGRAISKPRNTAYEEFVRRRMEIKFYEIKHKIDFCGTTEGLEEMTNDTIEFWELYKYEPGIDNKCGELQSAIENRRYALKSARRIRA